LDPKSSRYISKNYSNPAKYLRRKFFDKHSPTISYYGKVNFVYLAKNLSFTACAKLPVK
jgi:hypothetical protein